VIAHDEEPDHEGRRSQLVLVPYMLGQVRRARIGRAALAGNHVVIAVHPQGPLRIHPYSEIGLTGGSRFLRSISTGGMIRDQLR